MNKTDRSNSADFEPLLNKKDVLCKTRYKDNTPKNFACADTETDDTGRAVMYSVVGKDRNGKYHETVYTNYNAFELTQHFLNTIRQFSLVYFHNLEYDMNALFGTEWVEQKHIFRGSSLLLVSYAHTKKIKTKFVDSVALLPGKLEDIGAMLGHKKIDPDGDFLNEEYCLNDSVLLYKGLRRFFNTLMENKFCYANTLSSIFIKTLQTTLKHDVYHLDYKALKFIRNAYKGGRAECFRLGKVGSSYAYDINSMYPHIMSTIKCANPGKGWKTKEINEERFSVIYCKVKVPESVMPVLCVKHNSKLIFPSGVFDGYFTSEELLYAQKKGCEVLKIYEGIEFEYFEKNIYKYLIDKIYNLKNDSDSDLGRFIFKRLMNSGYGKTGQSDMQYLFDEESKTIELTELKEFRYFANQVHAVQTTANARVLIHSYAEPYYPEKLFYIDTDCVHIAEKDIKESDKLGKMKLENHGSAEYRGNKYYRLGEKIRIKGVPSCFKNANCKPGCNCATKYAWHHHEVIVNKPVKIRSALRFGKKVNVWEKNVKHLSRKYDKRIVNKDGTTSPLIFKKGEAK